MPYSPINKQAMANDPFVLANRIANSMPKMGPVAKPLSKFQQLKDQFFGGLPAGSEGLLSAEDLAGAQKQGMLNLGMSLLADSGPKRADEYVGPMAAIGKSLQAAKGGYSEALNSAAQLRSAGQEFKGKQQALDANTALVTGREGIIKKFGSPDPKNPQAFAAWIDQALPEFVRIGDTDTVRSLSEVRKSIGNTPKRDINTVNTGGETIMYDNATGQEIRRMPNSPAPWDPQRGAESRDLARQANMGRREDRFVNSYTKDIDKDRESHALIGMSLQNAPLAMQGDGAAQIQIVNAFVKSLDPGTANREGEVELARQAAPVMAQAKAFLQKYSTNKSALVPPELIASMQGLLEKQLQGKEKYMKDRRDYWIRRANRAGIPDPDTLYDDVPAFQMPGAAAPAPGTPAARPPLGSLR